MKAKSMIISLTLAALGLAGSAAMSADSGSQAKVTRAAAEKTALSRVPGGRIKEGELEKEHGKLVWSFDIAKPSSADIIEIQVDAISGTIVSQETETPADQAKEAAASKAKVGKAKVGKKPAG